MSLILNNLNEIPAKTFNWLKVNDITLEDNNIQPKSYNSDYFQQLNIAGVSITKTEKQNMKLPLHKGLNDFLYNDSLKNFNSGFTLNIDDNITVNDNIYINYFMDENNNYLTDTNIINIGANSNATIYIYYTGNTNSYNNSYTSINIGKGSTAQFIFIQTLYNQSTNLQCIHANIEENANGSFIIAEAGAKNIVSNVSVALKQETSKASIDTLYLGNKTKKIDLNYNAIHYGKNSTSSIVTKGVLLDDSKKVFKGGIDFKKGATGSDGQLLENVLLLSKTAKNSSVPLLLCEEDDVKGEHAASVGQLDEDMLFYLMTRGLDLSDAKKLLLESYFNPVIDLIGDDAVRKSLKEAINIEVNIDESYKK